MKIGLLSDTHGFLDPRIQEHFRDCDEVWHAGDIGSTTLADALQSFKPLRAVHGNIDDKEIQARFPENLYFTCEGLSVWMTHIGGAPPRYNARINRMLKERVPDVFVCGHSHILRVVKDPAWSGMLYLNPGAAGNQGFHPIKTLLRFEIVKKEIRNLEAIELGRRGAISN